MTTPTQETAAPKARKAAKAPATKKAPAKKVKLDTREAWLKAAVAAIRPLYKEAAVDLPKDIVALCGFPTSPKAIGECHYEANNVDPKLQRQHIYVCPTQADPVRVLDILVHELVHASGCKGHGKEFKAVATKLGLTGKMTATVAGPELETKLKAIAKTLGKYPHEAVKRPGRNKVGGKPSGWTRFRAVNEDELGGKYRVLISDKMVEAFGAPRDPNGVEMIAVYEGE